jgi:WD40 repeat protein
MSKYVLMWNLNNGQQIRNMTGHTGPVNAIKLLNTANVASGSDDKSIIIWSLSTGAALCTLSSHTAAVTSLVVLPNGALASGLAIK